ncbi:DEAD/DEAH box helicase [Rhodohalobacter sulfatireducens]|uniref:DEAD/DEAH box helicase n=1 Tax=Rhodohalobacter sulfatireducens TaxID=2911366 RepID=A0ABS9KIU0_9BACT|nr:DEAD/DEAH box helicase [Rhodohalobacter sulfatireducens]MCG2590763.1 DEAD/DEAH box helicase [Rhodohalobacter sulfatireducens]
MKSLNQDARNRTEVSNTNQWQIKNGEVVFVDSGQLIKINSSDIVKVEYKDKKEIHGTNIRNKPSIELKNLKFHRFPLSIEVKLLIPETKKVKPHLLLKAVGENIRVDLKKLPDSDQLILDSQWYPILKSEMDQIHSLFEDFELESSGPINLSKCIEIAKGAPEYVEITSEDAILDKEDLIDQNLDVQAKLDENGFEATLYDYQRTGVFWLNMIAQERLGCILADEMGLGKTIQIIALVLLNNREMPSPTLVIAPATLLENWRREIKKFAPDLKILIHIGSDRTGFPSYIKEYDIVISSYDTAVRDYSMLNMINWSFFVIDEAQAIKNPETQRANILKKLDSDVYIAVTGTPVENSLTDLWSIMDFCNKGFLGDREYFETNYQDSIEDAKRVEQIVSPFILRRTIPEVANNLPEKIIIPQPIPLSDEASRKYEEIRLEIERKYEANASLVSIVKLRQFCAHPKLLDESIDGDPAFTSTKFLRLMELMDEIKSNEEKCVVFTSYLNMSDIISDYLSRYFGMKSYQIDGRIPVKERQKIVDAFSEREGASLLVLNPKAAGTGLNITSANHVIHYNLEWNPAVEDQATARVHRLGQRRPVTVHRLYHPNTVEEVINERLSRKRELSEEAIIGTEGEDEDLADIRKSLKKSPILSN